MPSQCRDTWVSSTCLWTMLACPAVAMRYSPFRWWVQTPTRVLQRVAVAEAPQQFAQEVDPHPVVHRGVLGAPAVVRVDEVQDLGEAAHRRLDAGAELGELGIEVGQGEQQSLDQEDAVVVPPDVVLVRTPREIPQQAGQERRAGSVRGLRRQDSGALQAHGRRVVPGAVGPGQPPVSVVHESAEEGLHGLPRLRAVRRQQLRPRHHHAAQARATSDPRPRSATAASTRAASAGWAAR